MLQNFVSISGLCINLGKNGLACIDVEYHFLGDLSNLVVCAILHWPITHLGVLLGGNPHLVTFWDLVIIKISKRMDNWEGAFFLFGVEPLFSNHVGGASLFIIFLCLRFLWEWLIILRESGGIFFGAGVEAIKRII